MNPSLHGHVALVAGANHAIGAATARTLSARGATVVVSYLRIPDSGNRDVPELYRSNRALDATAVVAAHQVRRRSRCRHRSRSFRCGHAGATLGCCRGGPRAGGHPDQQRLGLGGRHVFSRSRRPIRPSASASFCPDDRPSVRRRCTRILVADFRVRSSSRGARRHVGSHRFAHLWWTDRLPE
jgi:hypothetical protein